VAAANYRTKDANAHDAAYRSVGFTTPVRRAHAADTGCAGSVALRSGITQEATKKSSGSATFATRSRECPKIVTIGRFFVGKFCGALNANNSFFFFFLLA